MQTVRAYTTDFQRQIVSHAHESMVGNVSVVGVVQSEDDGRVLLIRRQSTSHLIAGHIWALPRVQAGSAEMLEDIATEMFTRYLGSAFGEVGFGEPHLSADKSSLIVPAVVTVSADTLDQLTAGAEYDALVPGQERDFLAPIERDSAEFLQALGHFALS
ncbi:hypothetical protein JMUB6875_17130 [Nocardia sp. JMUB6875]|uniref:hypothetical protein n=1 Tax=Nocardia sp. JMUB6875 TaxID=3158170 RepID=UPI0032E53EBA